MRKSISASSVVVTFLFIFFAALSHLSTWASAKKATVFTESAKMEESSESFLVPAQITSAVNSKIIAEGDGLLVSLKKIAGERVKTGEVLAIVKNTDPACDYAPLKIRSMVAGAVAFWEVTEGAVVTRGQILGTLVDPNRIKVSVEIPAADMSKIRVGQKARLRLENLDSPIELLVSSLSPALDPMTGTLRVELLPGKVSAKARSFLTSGLLAKVEILGDARPAFLVSQDAIVYKEAKQFLRIVSQNKATFVPVTVGKSFGERIEITSGLKVGDSIVLRASGFVGDGQEVEIFVPENTASKEKAADKSATPQAR